MAGSGQGEQEEQIVVGRIMSPYGIKGWVKVYSYTDPLEGILDYAPWQVVKGTRTETLNIESGKPHGRGLIALPEGFETRSAAEALAGFEIRVARSTLPPLKEGEFYWHQLLGLTVVNEAGDHLGIVENLLETGANDVMVVKPDTTSIDDRERLVPYVEGEIIKQVDLDKSRILVNWESDY